MTDLPEKNYKHLTDEDLGILLGGYRVIKFKDDPKELKGVDVPTGLELVYEIQRRLKKSGPNLSWDQAVERRQSPTPDLLEFALPQIMPFPDKVLQTTPEQMRRTFETMYEKLVVSNNLPDYWPSLGEASHMFSVFLMAGIDTLARTGLLPSDCCVVFSKETNPVLMEINKERALKCLKPIFCFLAKKGELKEVI